MTIPKVPGKLGVLWYNEAFPPIPIMQTDLPTWIASGVKCDPIVNLGIQVTPMLAEVTSKIDASNRQTRSYLVNQRLLVSFNFYLEEDQGSASFSKFFMNRLMINPRTPTGFVILEDQQNPSNGFAGDFFIEAQKTEPLRGIQEWSVTLHGTGSYWYQEDIVNP